MTARILSAAVRLNKTKFRKPRNCRAIATAVEFLEDRRLFTAISSTPTGGNWNNPASWVGGVVPNSATDAVIVAGSSITVSDSEQVALLTTQAGSTLTLVTADSSHVAYLHIYTTGSSVNGTLNSGPDTDFNVLVGTTTLSGTSNITGGISGGTVDNTGTMNLGGSAADLNGVILTNDATLNLANGVAIGNADIVNNADGTWNITDNSGVRYDSYSPAGNNNLINMGTLNKTGAGGTFTLIDSYIFENIGGTINVESGNFSVAGDIRLDGGSFNISTGSTFSIDSDITGENFVDGVTTGTGGGTFAMNAGDFVPESPTSTASDGTLDFPAGMAIITGASFGNGAPNHIFNTGFLTFTGSATHGSFSIDNQGTVTNTGTADLPFGTFINDTTGVLDLTNDVSIVSGGPNQENLTNLGTVNKTSGTGVTVVSAVYFGEGGTFNIQTGSISLQNIQAIYIAGSAFTIAAGSVLDFDYINNINVSGTLAATGGGTVTFTAGQMSGAVQFDTADGTLPAILNFAANTFYDVGGVIAMGNTGITNTGAIYYRGNTTLGGMTNQGTLFIDAGPFELDGNITNANTGVINFIADTVLSQPGGALTNNGLIIKSGGTGTIAFTNAGGIINQGTIEAGSGTIQLPSGAQGIFSYTPQSELQVNAGQTLKVDAGASITLDQTINLTTNSGTVILGGAGATFPALSTLNTNAGTLAILSGASFTTGAALTNTGTVTVGGDLVVTGDLTESGTPTLDFLVDANPGAAGIPSLTVTGTTTLAGNLTAELASGFVLTSEGTYPVAHFSSTAMGSFASTSGVGPAFTVAVNPTTIVLTTAGDVGPTPTAGLVPVITKNSIPTALIAGVKSHGNVTITVTNTGAPITKGLNLVSLYASTNGVIDSSSILVGRVEKGLHLATSKSSPVTIPIRSVILPTGTYTLLAQATNVAGAVIASTTGPTLVAAAPFVALTETLTNTLPTALVSGTTTHGNVVLVITNNGNVASKGFTGFNITASTAAGVLGTSIFQVSKPVTVQPGKTAHVSLQIKSIPSLANGNYFLVAQVTDPFAGGTSISSSAAATTIAAPFIALTASLGTVVKATTGDLLTILNTGNVADTSIFQVTLGFSTDPAGAQPVGGTLLVDTTKLNIPVGRSVKVHFNQWKSILSSLPTGVSYYLTASVIDDSTNTAFAVSPNTFAD